MSEEALKFILQWTASRGRSTTATLTVGVGGEIFWPVEHAPEISLEFQADDLLSYLTEYWKPLVLRQTYPIGAKPERPSLLRSEAERRWSSHPAQVAEREDELVSAFEEAHDLSRCFAGQFGLPPLWLFRMGDRMLVETSRSMRAVSFVLALEAFASIGDEIATRLKSSGDDRWVDLIDAWYARDRGDPAVNLARSASLERDVAQRFALDGVLPTTSSVAEAANDSDELSIAARMAGALPPEQIRQIIDHVSHLGQTHAPRLDAIEALAVNHIGDHFANHRPYEQGEAAALFVRRQLDLDPVQQVDIFAVVDQIGAMLRLESVAPATLFALAVWGRHHGPAILLNRRSLRLGTRDIRRDGAARVTLAHEFCHLLLDRAHALSAVEILESRMPLDIERRAKAFAGEFLLPGRVAADIWRDAGQPRSIAGLDAILRSLVQRFGVTKTVAAWKLEHGLQRHNIDLRVVLDALVPNR